MDSDVSGAKFKGYITHLTTPTRTRLALRVLLLQRTLSSCLTKLEPCTALSIPNGFRRVRRRIQGIYHPFHYPSMHEASPSRSLSISLSFLLPPKIETAIAARVPNGFGRVRHQIQCVYYSLHTLNVHEDSPVFYLSIAHPLLITPTVVPGLLL